LETLLEQSDTFKFVRDIAVAGIGGRGEGRHKQHQRQPRAALGARETASDGEETYSPQVAASAPNQRWTSFYEEALLDGAAFDGKYYKPTEEEESDDNFRGVLEPGLCLGAYFDCKYGQLIKDAKKEGKMCKIGDLKEAEMWYGHRSMIQVTHANLKHMRFFQYLENLEHWFEVHNLYETKTRIQFLELGIQDLPLRQELHSVQDEALSEGEWELTWSQVREHALQQFSLPTWLHEIMQAWQASQDQGSKTAAAWVTDFNRWNSIVRPIAGEDAISTKMEALLLRGGANPELNVFMSIRPYRVFNPKATHGVPTRNEFLSYLTHGC